MNEQFSSAIRDGRSDRRVARDAKDRLTVDLRRRILTLELEPGIHLDETSLSRAYGISRTPLRDVFRHLAGEGFIQLRDNRGAVVAPMDHKTLRVFFQTAPLIYVAVARLAAENAQPAQIDDLRAMQTAMTTAVDRGEANDIVYCHNQFHMSVGEMAANPYLLPSLQRLLIDHSRIGHSFWHGPVAHRDSFLERVVGRQDSLIDRLASRDAEAAAEAAIDVWNLSRAYLEQAVRPDPLPIDTAAR